MTRTSCSQHYDSDYLVFSTSKVWQCTSTGPLTCLQVKWPRLPALMVSLCRVSQPPGDKVITLPVESWVSMSTSDDLINIQAGVMLDKQSMYVARMEYKDLQPCTAFLGVDSHT